jgi:hypothetical protein
MLFHRQLCSTNSHWCAFLISRNQSIIRPYLSSEKQVFSFPKRSLGFKTVTSGPAGHNPSPPFAHLLNLYRICVAEGRWARFSLETKYVEEELSFTCSGRPAAAAPSPSAPSTQKHCRKCPPNQRRREKERRRQEVRKENRRHAHVAALPAAAGLATTSSAAISAAPVPVSAAVQEAAGQASVSTSATQLAAVPPVAPPAAAVRVAAVTRAAIQVTAGPVTAISTAAVPVAAVLRAAAIPVAAAPEAVSCSAAVPAAAKRATAALRERRKTAAGERRASARASVLAKRRDSSVVRTPETLWFPEMEVLELELSLYLGEGDSVFPPLPEEVQREKEEGVMEPETHWNRWKRENLPPECI